MRPILFQIGDFRFYSFGLMAALALIVPGLTIVLPLVRRRGVPGEFAYELIIAAGIGGFVGARIYYLIENYARVQTDFWGAAFGSAGFTWYGGLIGGFRRCRRLDAGTAHPARHHRQRDRARYRVRLPHRAHRLPARRRRRLRQAERPALGDGVSERHGTHPTRSDGPSHPDLRDHRHGVRGLDPLAAGDTLRQVRLVDLRLVPDPLRHRAVPGRVRTHQPRCGSAG